MCLNFSGGELIAVVMAVDEEGQYLGSCKAIKQNLFTFLTVLWQGMVAEDRITQVCVNTLSTEIKH